jgi:hypothetical protein
MNKKKLKEKLFKLLDKPMNQISLKEHMFIENNMTYEILNEWMDINTTAVEIDGFNSVPMYEVSAFDILINTENYLQ